ncbi:hypothetical protein PHLCEN_2v11939 [Hermanssonia centrifuga]|uniref:Uncharacterized protein n=1 Tax=Hermanssonia centrifuga TaxID=98765 RepID=A0A2R6NIW4_9APHY|nr:hypothetical protein PHLCEN_2v11939 [Hermanssonia centrifuga]
MSAPSYTTYDMPPLLDARASDNGKLPTHNGYVAMNKTVTYCHPKRSVDTPLLQQGLDCSPDHIDN